MKERHTEWDLFPVLFIENPAVINTCGVCTGGRTCGKLKTAVILLRQKPEKKNDKNIKICYRMTVSY